MQVLLVTNMYPTAEHPFYGIFVKKQVECLRNEGVFVDVFFINGRENRLNYFTSMIGLLKKIKLNHYNIIHAHHTYCVYPILVVKWILGVKTPLILTFHEGEVYKPKELKHVDGGVIKRLAYSKMVKKIAVNSVDLVITVEKGLMQVLDFEGRTAVLPCGVDLHLFQPMEKIRCRKKLNLPIDKKIIFFPAHPERAIGKGFDTLNEALKLLHREDIILLKAGNIPYQNMTYYMCAADVVVHPSRFESGPLVIKEAMACNVPLVSTDVGDVKKVIGNSEGCYICERNPRDVAKKIEAALEFNARTKGRDRILALGLGLYQISRKIIEAYEGLVRTPQAKKDN